MKLDSSKIKSFIKEIVIVIIGILIALSINNWNESIKNNNYTEKALSAIEKEIKINQADVKNILQRHVETIDTLYVLMKDDMSLLQFIDKMGGLQVPELKNIGLRFFISNKADLIDYEVISQLSEIEFMNELLQSKTKNLSDFLYANLDSTREGDKFKLMLFLEDMAETEEGLLELYSAYLKT